MNLRRLLNSNAKVKNGFTSGSYKDFRSTSLGNVIKIDSKQVVDSYRGILHMIMYITASIPKNNSTQESHINLYYKKDRRKKEFSSEPSRIISTYTTALSFKVDTEVVSFYEVLAHSKEYLNYEVRSELQELAKHKDSTEDLITAKKKFYEVFKDNAEELLDKIEEKAVEDDDQVLERLVNRIKDAKSKVAQSPKVNLKRELFESNIQRLYREGLNSEDKIKESYQILNENLNNYVLKIENQNLSDKLLTLYIYMYMSRLDKRHKYPNGYGFKVTENKDIVIYPNPTVDSEVKVNCTCGQFFYTFAWYNADHDVLIGPKPPAYVKPFKGKLVNVRDKDTTTIRNLNKNPGLCKHLQFFISYLFGMNKIAILNSKEGSRRYNSKSAKDVVSKVVEDSTEVKTLNNDLAIETAKNEYKEYQKELHRGEGQVSFYKEDKSKNRMSKRRRGK